MREKEKKGCGTNVLSVKWEWERRMAVSVEEGNDSKAKK